MAYELSVVDTAKKFKVDKKEFLELCKGVDDKSFFGDDKWNGNSQLSIKLSEKNIKIIKGNVGKLNKANKYTTANNTTIKFIPSGKTRSTNAKTDKGGGTRGGRGVEVPSEGLFCVYVAMESKGTLNKYVKDNGNTAWNSIKSSSDLQKLCKKYGIATMVAGEIKSSSDFAQPNNGIKLTKGWLPGNHDVMVRQAKAFCGKYKLSGSHELIRADNLENDISPYNVFTDIAKRIGGGIGIGGIDGDKWNPADVWILTSKGKTALKSIRKKIRSKKTTSATDIVELNNVIYKGFKSNDIFPVSLKKPGKGSVLIKQINDRGSDLKQIFKFKNVELTNGNKDVKLNWIIEYKKGSAVQKDKTILGRLKMKTEAGGFRLELEYDKVGDYRPGAGMGSLGTKAYMYSIYNTSNQGINVLKKIRKDKKKHNFKNLENVNPSAYNSLLSPGATDWIQPNVYKKLSKTERVNILEGYLGFLFKGISGQKFTTAGTKGTKEDIIFNKTVAAEIATAIKNMPASKANEACQSIYKFAASEGFSINTKLDKTGTVPDFSKKNANVMFNACFHVKVM